MGLNHTEYMTFPFEIGENGAATSKRGAHVRELIEQVLFTNPSERVYRPEFGAGVRALVFEPNNSVLWNVTHKRLLASLTEALRGEVDPKTLEVTVEGEEAEMRIVITYTLAALGHTERQEILIGKSS